MSNLHKPASQNSRQNSTVAYAIMYYPWSKLSPQTNRLVAWQKTIVFEKSELLDFLDEDCVKVTFPGDNSQFVIKWEYNNIPTEEQWNALEWDQLIRVQFRVSSLAGDTGRIAILSLIGFGTQQLASERLK